MTPLDQAFAAMQAAPSDDAARLAYYARLADAELCLLLAEEATGADLTPQMFDLAEGRFVLMFEGEERMAAFVGEVSAYAALPGRVVAGLLAGQGIGIGVNLGSDASLMIPAEAVDWLVEVLGQGPQVVEAQPSQILPPGTLPDALLSALSVKLAQAAGLADAAYLAGVRYSSGARGHLLAFVGAGPAAEAALARAASEALTFSGLEAGQMDVTFVGAADAILHALIRHGLWFDLTRAPGPGADPSPPPAPGSDPARPPILR